MYFDAGAHCCNVSVHTVSTIEQKGCIAGIRVTRYNAVPLACVGFTASPETDGYLPSGPRGGPRPGDRHTRRSPCPRKEN